MVCTREVRVEADIYDKKKYKLKQVYLGSMISENGGYEEEVRHRVGAGWGKWREMPGKVYKWMPMMLKAAVCKTVIRPVILYGSETRPVRKAEQNLI